MTDKHILLREAEPGIYILSLNRPEKRNALSITFMMEICATLEHLETSHQVRALILKGEGPVFCSGLDLEEAVDPAKEEESADLVTRTLLAVYKAPFATVAAVQGAAIAGGAGLMACCDSILAADSAKIAFPEVLRGLVPAQVSTILSKQFGSRRLRHLMLTGATFTAAEGVALGLVDRAVPQADLDVEALQTARQYLRAAPEALRITKHLIDELYAESMEADLIKTLPVHHASRASAEAREGVAAFKENRNPNWIP